MAHVCVCPDAGDNPLMSFIWLAASTPQQMQPPAHRYPDAPIPAAIPLARPHFISLYLYQQQLEAVRIAH